MYRRQRRDSTVKLRCVGGVNAPVGSRDSSRDPVYNSCAVELFRLVTSDDKMTLLLKKLLMSIKIHVVKPLCSVSEVSTECVGSRRELFACVLQI